MAKQPHLGEKLREAMTEMGVSQAQVARDFGVKAPTVNNAWLRRGRIAKRHYPHLVDYFGKPYEWWFGEQRVSRKFPTSGAKNSRSLPFTLKGGGDVRYQLALEVDGMELTREAIEVARVWMDLNKPDRDWSRKWMEERVASYSDRPSSSVVHLAGEQPTPKRPPSRRK